MKCSGVELNPGLGLQARPSVLFYVGSQKIQALFFFFVQLHQAVSLVPFYNHDPLFKELISKTC